MRQIAYILLVLAVAQGLRGEAPRASVTAVQLPSMPIIDGVIDQALIGSNHLDIAEDFVLIGPDAVDARPHIEGGAAVGYCDQGLYFVARMMKKREEVYANSLRRDALSIGGEDCIFVFLDASRDRRNAFFFGVNAHNTKADGTITVEGGFLYAWDADWSSTVRVENETTIYEIFIPWRSIGFKGGIDTMGLNIVVSSLTPMEIASWARCYRGFSEVSTFNSLVLPVPVEPPLVLSFRPQSRFHNEKSARFDNDKIERNEITLLRGSVDILFRSREIADCVLTFRPDFAEAEPDADEIILEREEQRYLPEKRLFFQMGLGLLSSRVFYTRRIEKIDYGAKAQGKIGSADYAIFGWKGWGISNPLDGVFGATGFSLGRRVSIKAVGGAYKTVDRWACASQVDTRVKITPALLLEGDFSLHNEPKADLDSTLNYGIRALYEWQTASAGVFYRSVGNLAEPSTGFMSELGYKAISGFAQKTGRIRARSDSYWAIEAGGSHYLRQDGERYKSGADFSCSVAPSEKLFFSLRPEWESIVFYGQEYTNQLASATISYGRSFSLSFGSVIGKSFGADIQLYAGIASASIGSWLRLNVGCSQLRQHWEHGSADRQMLVNSRVTWRPKEWVMVRAFAEYSEISDRLRTNGIVVFDPGYWKVILAASHDHPTHSNESREEQTNLVFKVSYNIQVR